MSGEEKDSQSTLRRWIHVLFLEEDRVRFKEAVRLFKQTRSLNILFKEFITFVKTPEQMQILNVLREGFFSANPSLFDKICFKNFPDYRPSTGEANKPVAAASSGDTIPTNLQHHQPDKSQANEISRESPFSTASLLSIASERPADENISPTAQNSRHRPRNSESSYHSGVLQLRSRSRTVRDAAAAAAPLTEEPIVAKMQSTATATPITPSRAMAEPKGTDTSVSSVEPSHNTSTPQSPEKSTSAHAQKPLKPALHKSKTISNGGQANHSSTRLMSPPAENVQYAPMNARQDSNAKASCIERPEPSSQYSARKPASSESESGHKLRTLTPRSQSSHSFATSLEPAIFSSSITINLSRPLEISTERTHYEPSNSTQPTPSRVDEIYARHKKQQEVLSSIMSDGDAKPKKTNASHSKMETKRLATGGRQRSFNTKNLTEMADASLPSASMFEHQQPLQHPLNRMFAPSLAQYPPWPYGAEGFEQPVHDFYNAGPVPYFYCPPMPMGYMQQFPMHMSQQQPPPLSHANTGTGQGMYQRSRSQMVGVGAHPMSPENSGPGTICGVYERVGSNFHWGLGIGAAGGGLSAGEGHGSRGIGGTLLEIRKVLMERQADGRYGFTLRAGERHPGGLFVAHVEPNDTAFLCGLRENDRVLKINGLSAKSISLQQAIGMVQTSNSLRLYVASVSTPSTPAASLTDLSIASSLQEQDLDSDATGTPLSPTDERHQSLQMAIAPVPAHRPQLYGTLTRGTRPQLFRVPADVTLPRRSPRHKPESQQPHPHADQTTSNHLHKSGRVSPSAVVRSKNHSEADPEDEPEPERDSRDVRSPLYRETSPDIEAQVETLQRSLHLSPSDVTLVAHSDTMGSTKQLADAGVEEEVVQKRAEPVRADPPAVPVPPVHKEPPAHPAKAEQLPMQAPSDERRRPSVSATAPDAFVPKSEVSSAASTQKKKKLMVAATKSHAAKAAVSPKPSEQAAAAAAIVVVASGVDASVPIDNHPAPSATPRESDTLKASGAAEESTPHEPQETLQAHTQKKEPQKIKKMRKEVTVVADRGYFGFIIGSTPSLIVSGSLLRRLKTPAIAVLTVEADSPAERADLQVGDVIIEINAQPVAELEQDTIAELMHRDPESVRLRLERYLLVT